MMVRSERESQHRWKTAFQVRARGDSWRLEADDLAEDSIGAVDLTLSKEEIWNNVLNG